MPPAPVYKGARGGGGRPGGGRAKGGVLLPPGVGLPPFLVGVGEGGKRREREEGKGGRRPPPCPIRTRGGGVRGCPGRASPSPTKAHEAQLTPGGFR